MRLLRVDGNSRVVLGMAGMCWAGAAAGRWWGAKALVGLVAGMAVAALVGRSRRTLVGMAALIALSGWWSGHMSAQREAAILSYPTPGGAVESLTVRLLDDPRQGEHGWWALAVSDPPEAGRPDSVPMLLDLADAPPAQAGERLRVEGYRHGRSGRARGDPYSGVVAVEAAEGVSTDGISWWTAGNLVRSRALDRLRGMDPERALLAGFLVGDTTGVPDADMEAMRRTGLTHLVAVSGSNVSLFLTMTLVAAGPLASGPRRRAVVGLVAVGVLVVATRWEPSVVRASAMAALMLAGRLGGWAPNAAVALGVTVIGVVSVFGELATDVGFSLSVLATLGVLGGANFPFGSLPRPLATALGATMGAQMAVAPLLLAVFGQMPVLSPVANLIAVPVVAVTTMVGAVAVAIGWEMMIEIATWGSALVLAVARAGASWPQMGWGGLLLVTLAVGLSLVPRLRGVVAVGTASVVAWAMLAGSSSVPAPGAVVLDVGQGDAILLVSGDGRRALVDGGPDPGRLEEKLSSYGVTALDLVVLTHVHADHAAGLEAVIGRRPVGQVWMPTVPHSSPAWEAVERLLSEHGVPAFPPPVGEVVQMGDLRIEVLGPIRRYASPNDQSIVLRVRAGGGPRLLLTGDIETHAQADLGAIEAEILKVPHQGAATSDLAWLQQVGAGWAIVSVGPNDFGHPAPAVVAALRAAGARVSRTDVAGDVVVPLAATLTAR
ncbi:MAG: ComEC/Rec2 family competence protein [Actinomycetota bacterium]